MHPRPYDPFFSIHACSPDNPYDAGYIAYGSMPLLHTLQSPCYSFPYSRQTPNPQVVHHAPAHQQQNTPFHKSPECHELPASPLTSPNLRKAMSQMTLVTDQSMRGNYAASMHSARADYPESPIAKSYPRPPVWYNDYTAAFHVNSKERNPLNLSMSDLSRAPCNAPTNPPNSTVPNRRQSTISRQPAPTRALSTIIPNTKPQPSQSLLSRPSTRHIPPRPYQPDLTPINKPLSGPNHSTKTSNVDRYALEQGPHINFRPTPSTTRTKFAGAEVQRMHNMVPSRLAGEGVEVLGPRMRFFDPNGMPYSTLVERIREKEVLDGRAQRRSGTAGGPDSGFLKNDGRYFKGM
ncbi:hypothetical protein B0J11DRAFT_520285 [Dendryphion nanum]|uniref:Uncharacterized protein n=1 Tax=Dendryphion nanum TaxID=256645 RepID=A0A9P9IUU5_9PLEO|nr:hypothetical protein B0J11DRAFT_520285 [Dendryphion nanum]